jgi:hypothetical protein
VKYKEAKIQINTEAKKESRKWEETDNVECISDYRNQ